MIRAGIAALLALAALAAAEPAAQPWRTLLASTAGDGAKPVPFRAKRGSFELPSQVANNPTVTVTWVSPLNPDGSPAPRAQDVVCYLHYPGETGFASNEPFIRLWEESGFTVMCAYFAQQAASDGVDLYDRTRSYVWAESGAFAVLTAAHARLTTELGLPARPLLLYGESAGATAAQHLSEELPERVDAVAALGGHRFLQKNRATCPFLVLSTLGDATNDDNAGLALYRRRDGHAILDALTSPDWSRRASRNAHFNHCLSRPARALARRWLEGVADLRRGRGVVPKPEAWPIACHAADARRVEETSRAGWRERLGREPLVFLPSLRCWAEWLRQAPPARRGASGSGPALELPARHLDAAALVLLSWRRGTTAGGLLDPHRQAEWDARWLLDKGFAVVRTEAGPEAPADVLAAAGRLGVEPGWPLYVLAADPEPGDLAPLAALARLRGLLILCDLRRDHAGMAAALAALPPGLRVRVAGLAEGKRYAGPLSGLAPAVELDVVPAVAEEWPGKQRQQQIDRLSQALATWTAPPGQRR